MTSEALGVALQAALAGEHAAVWASGRAAAVLGGGRREEALRELDGHRQARDLLREHLVSRRLVPVAPAAAYLDPFPIVGPTGGRRLMAHVNTALAATYADLAAAGGPGERAAFARQSWRAAVRALGWGAAAQAFPGA